MRANAGEPIWLQAFVCVLGGCCHTPELHTLMTQQC